MMFSTEKCSGPSESGAPEEKEIYADSGNGVRREDIPAGEVASAVAAASDEIGDILKDELVDADRADQIGAELADLSAELGLLAGLADGETQPGFPSLFEIAQMGHRGSASGSSTSSTSSDSSLDRPRRPPRPIRMARRKPIGKGKEFQMSRRRSAVGRRAVSLRLRRSTENVSDASDVGADCDSEEQWTSLDDTSASSGSSSEKETGDLAGMVCSGYEMKFQEAEAPPMGQFLLPLLSTETANAAPEHFLMRHEDILQLLASAEESVRADCDDTAEVTEMLARTELFSCEKPFPVTAEEEAILLHYVREAERLSSEPTGFKPVAEWLLGVYHSWCEISALMYTMIGTTMSVEMETDDWLYRAHFPCHCRLCLCLADCPQTVALMLASVLTALHGERTTLDAIVIMRALGLREPSEEIDPSGWDFTQVPTVSQEGAEIIQEQLLSFRDQNEIAKQIVDNTCLCRPCHRPMDKQFAVERFFKILENFKTASTITFKVEMVLSDGRRDSRLEQLSTRLARSLAPYQRCAARARLTDMAQRTPTAEVSAWAGYRHRCECLSPRTLCAQQRKELLRLSFFGMMQVVNELNSNKSEAQTESVKPPTDVETTATGSELQQGDGTGAKPPDSDEQPVSPEDENKDLSDVTEDLDDENITRDLSEFTQDDVNEVKDLPELEDENITRDLDDFIHDDDENDIKDLPDLDDDNEIKDLPELNDEIEIKALPVLDGAKAMKELDLDDENEKDLSDDTSDLDDESDANSGTPSLEMSSSSLDSASELLIAAAAAVESGSDAEPPGELCRTVKHLMRSIASIERLMDRVLKHCDEWASPPATLDDARKRVDMGLSEVDRKLMAMYRRLPQVHKKQLQLYRKQKKLSTVCMRLVGGMAPAPPPPGSPPPLCPPPAALCLQYHLQRFKEVRRKVMHMRDQQLYYHRLRTWLEDQLRHERVRSKSESNVALIEDLPRRKRRTTSPKAPRLTTASKRKLKPGSPSISKSHKILQMLKLKAPPQTAKLLGDDKFSDDVSLVSEAEPPEAFPLERDDVSDTETIVGEKETADICKEMKECLAKFANFALRESDLLSDYDDIKDYPDSVSPPLQEMSPTTTEPMPVYTPKPNQRLLSVNKLLTRGNIDNFSNKTSPEFPPTLLPEVLNVTPLNARRTPVLVEDDKANVNTKMPEMEIEKINTDVIVDTDKDPNIYKYVTFGLEIKKAMEECQNIINSYNSIKNSNEGDQKIDDKEGALSLEQICEVMLNIDKNSAEFLDSDETIDANTANTKLAELVENMPQILANMPEIASKLSEFANASFELPEFASIMSSLPDVNNEAQLTPETLKQIRELKLNKTRDNVKVTKNTTKRKSNRKIKNNTDNNDMTHHTFEFDCKDISDLMKDEKELHDSIRNKSTKKEDFKDLLFSISAQVVINKVFEYLKNNKSPELAKCLEEERDFFTIPRNSINSEMFMRASTLFDNSVKDALSMEELRDLVKCRFNSWKNYVSSKFKSVPFELLDHEIEVMLDKFYSYIQDLASKQIVNNTDKIIEKLDEIRNANSDNESDSDGCSASKASLKQMTKLLSTSSGNTFDLLIMNLNKLAETKQISMKSLKFNFIDVIKRCAESPQLANWILQDPGLAMNVILDMSGIDIRTFDHMSKTDSLPMEQKQHYFIARIKDASMVYMDSLPKHALTGDEWLVILYRLEELQIKLKESLTKSYLPKVVNNQTNYSETHEAEILAGKGLSKIIEKANAKTTKKPECQKPAKQDEKSTVKSDKKNLPKPEVKEEKVDERKCRNDAVLAKCEAILISKGEKALLDSFFTIKSYITQGLPVPESYKKHVISICSSIDTKLLDEVIEDTLCKNIDESIENKPKCVKSNEQESDNASPYLNNKDKNSASAMDTPELLTKYLMKAKQTLNSVAFKKNTMRNGQTKSESDACDTPKTDCKWTNDCICDTCKNSDGTGSVCLGDIVKQCYDMEAKSKAGLEEKKKEAKSVMKPVARPTKPQPKACENPMLQQHVCKVGHNAVAGTCSSDGGNIDQPCTCCYCTVFGHAPPITTPVPRNFNETRERLRSILNKKKQKCKPTANGEAETADRKPGTMPAPPEMQPQLKPQPILCSLKPPVQPKPQLTAQPQPSNVPQENVDTQPDPKNLQRTAPVQVNVPPIVAPEGKVNVQAMEQIRIQQMKMQQQQQHQLLLQQHQQQQQLLLQQEKHRHQQKLFQQHQQLLQQRQQQQQQQQQQIAAIQPEMAPQTQGLHNSMMNRQQLSLSSRDTSVLSTASGCSRGSCWRGSHEDPRDLDALLQYIEGPARHVDRGKKKAKKQRQKAKKLETRLLEERAELMTELNALKRSAAAVRNAHMAAKKRVEDARAALKLSQMFKKKGKKQKMNPTQQAKAQLVSEQLGELTALLNNTSKELEMAESQVNQYTRRLEQCEVQLREARLVQREDVDPRKQHEIQQEQEYQLLRQKHQQLQQQIQLEQQRQMPVLKLQSDGVNISGTIRVRRSPGDGSVTMTDQDGKVTLTNHDGKVTLTNRDGNVTLTDRDGNVTRHTELRIVLAKKKPENGENVGGNQPPSKQTDSQKKQTWEQALAHMNQLVKSPANKEKKKPKEAPVKSEPKQKEPQRSQSLTDTQALSKKERRALARQQAEQEEAKRKEQELKAKKAEQKKQETAKTDTSKAAAKKEQKKETPVVKVKEDKQDKKLEKNEKKGKENKADKHGQAQQPTKQNKQQPPPAPSTKKEKKKEKQESKPQIVNITPDTTIEIVDKRGTCSSEPEKPASCSIMEQLSCGVQVADLRLPPGITLTRVQPNEKKEPPPIKSVPLWKCSQLAATPTPAARPAPVINADPALMTFTTASVAPAEPPKTIIIPETTQPIGKSKKAKKKAKKAAAAAETQPLPFTETKKVDGTKMVTLRNPMFHPNLPPVQMSPVSQQKKAESIRIPEPIPMPPTPCQATITPTSNGMYTIRNPLMSMMHQQTMMGAGSQTPQMNPMFPQQNYNYVNPNPYNPVHNVQPCIDPRTSPKNLEVKTDYQNPSRIMNLASFTQKNDEGYSLFKTNEDNGQRGFLNPEPYYLDTGFSNPSPKPTVSPNPIGTRPNNDLNRSFDSNDTSLFANNTIQRPEPIGTPLKRNEEERTDFIGGLYTPFGQEDRNVFRSALFDKGDIGSNIGRNEDVGANHMPNGDSLPYFQRLRVGSKLNSEVTIHHVTESKFYKGQELLQQPMEPQLTQCEDTLFSYPSKTWSTGFMGPSPNNMTSGFGCKGEGVKSSGSSSVQESVCESSGGSPLDEDTGFGAVGSRTHRPPIDTQSLFLNERPMSDLSGQDRSLEAMHRYEQQLYLQKHRLHHLNTN